MSSSSRLKAIRGATLVSENTEAAIRFAVKDLFETLIEANQLAQDSVLSILFSITPDLTRISPAKALREALNWSEVALFCAVEPTIEGLPPLCLRVLLHVEWKSETPPVMVYRQGAERLRPDLQCAG
jgi:chorismate mutase